MVQNNFTFFWMCMPVLFAGALVFGVVLIQRFCKCFRSIWRRLELFIFFVTVLYLSLFTLFVSAFVCFWCGNILWIKVSVSIVMVFGMLLFIVYVFCCIFEKGKERPMAQKTPAKAADRVLAAADVENMEERILRCLASLFEEKKIYREFDLRIEDVAMRIGTNRTYVSAVLNSRCGCHFQNYVNSFRIKEAKELLLVTSWSVGQVAQYVGYKNINTFNICFRGSVKLTPTEFRRMKTVF